MMQGNGSVAVRCGLVGGVLLFGVVGCSRPTVEKVEPPLTSVSSPLGGAEQGGQLTETMPASEDISPQGTGFESSPSLELRELRVVSDNGQEGMFLKLSGRPQAVTHLALDSPPRLVIEITSPKVRPGVVERLPVRRNPLIKEVRLQSSQGNLRVSAYLKSKVPPYTVSDLDSTVVVFIGEPTGGTKPIEEELVYSHRVGVIAGVMEEEPMPARSPQQPEPSPAVQTTETRTATGAKPAYVGQRVSLDFKDADVHNVLRLLAEVSRLNIVATDDVRGKVTLRLHDVPWDQALDIILQTLGLESVQEGNVIRISTVKRLREEREEKQKALEAAKVLEPLKVEYIKVNYTKAKNLADIISGAAASRATGAGARATVQEAGVLTNRGSVFVDELSNTIIVRDIQRGIENAKEVVRRLDVQTPQVLIESNIVEATTDFARELGVQWGYRYLAGPATGNPTGVNFPGTIGVGGAGLGSGTSGVPFIADFPAAQSVANSGSALNLALGSLDGAHALDMRLSAFERQGKARVVSRPRVVTLNNVPATIKSLTIIRVRLPSTGTIINTGAGGAVGAASAATEKIETGIILVVTPQVSSDGFVLLDMSTKSSQADFARTVDQIPTEITREANSHILVKSGQTIVLGGIYRDTFAETRTGIPFLKDVPGIGWLFRNFNKSDRREDLLVFLTPRILGTPGANLPTAEELWRNRSGAPSEG
ncbi:MAG: type IV pilus secretin PilQ [Candidatus Binatia bacterium]|nr:type IV pilus secretin PilQ [Candidatus Binatia bacterium]